MHIYYIAGIPYSDDLYHSGVKGQKWGLRRYQYEDGTLTPLGKIHYGAQKTGQAVGRAVKATGKAVGRAGKAVVKYEVDKFKRNHPWMMNDKELDAAVSKAKKIETLRTSRENARKNTFAGRLSNSLWSGFSTGVSELTKSVGINLGKQVADRIMESKDARKARELNDKNNLVKAKKNRRENKLQDMKDRDDFEKRKKEYYDKRKKNEDNKPNKSSSNSSKSENGKSHVNSSKNKAKNAKTSATKAASSAKASKGEKWTKKSNILEADYIFDSYGDYSSAKRGSMIRRG